MLTKEVGTLYGRVTQVGKIPVRPLQLDDLLQVYIDPRKIIFLNIDLIAYILILTTYEIIK